MTIHDLINLGIKKLSKTSNSPTLDAEVLLSHVLDKSKEYLLMNPDKQISPKLEKQFHILLQRRAAGWPVAYLNNQKVFYKLKFFVDKNVLIPRPETEGLVESILMYVRRYVHKKSLKILDIGTGSGNIIISIASSLSPQTSPLFFASDISAPALIVAKRNARKHKVKITFKQGSLLEPWGKDLFDIITANLPYLEKETDRSTKFEPKQALIAKKKGLALIEELFKELSLRGVRSSDRTTKQSLPQFVFLEIGHDQGSAIKKLAKKFLPAYECKIDKDLFGQDRFVILQLL